MSSGDDPYGADPPEGDCKNERRPPSASDAPLDSGRITGRRGDVTVGAGDETISGRTGPVTSRAGEDETQPDGRGPLAADDVDGTRPDAGSSPTIAADAAE